MLPHVYRPVDRVTSGVKEKLLESYVHETSDMWIETTLRLGEVYAVLCYSRIFQKHNIIAADVLYTVNRKNIGSAFDIITA